MMLDVDRLNELRLRFDQDGYVVVPDLVPHEKLDQMRTMVDAVLEGKLGPESPNSRGAVDDWDIQWEPLLANDPAVGRSKKVRVVFHMAHCHRFFWSHATR